MPCEFQIWNSFGHTCWIANQSIYRKVARDQECAIRYVQLTHLQWTHCKMEIFSCDIGRYGATSPYTKTERGEGGWTAWVEFDINLVLKIFTTLLLITTNRTLAILRKMITRNAKLKWVWIFENAAVGLSHGLEPPKLAPKLLDSRRLLPKLLKSKGFNPLELNQAGSTP